MNGEYVIIRGLPRSGKTVYARTLYKDSLIIEPDMYFMSGGVFKFDENKLGESKAWARMLVEYALEGSCDVVVTDTARTEELLKLWLDLCINPTRKIKVITIGDGVSEISQKFKLSNPTVEFIEKNHILII